MSASASGLHGPNRGLAGGEPFGDAAHLQRIGDDDARSPVLRGACRSGSRVKAWRAHRPGRSAGTAMCAVMMESTPRSMAARKGTNSMRPDARGRRWNGRQVHVCVGGGIAMARESVWRWSARGSCGSEWAPSIKPSRTSATSSGFSP